METSFLTGFGLKCQEGTLIQRYKRFLADIALPGEEKNLTVHVPNTGSMMGLKKPGSKVIISKSLNLNRKLSHTLECIQVGNTWVCVNTGRANKLAGLLLSRHMIPDVSGYEQVKSEPRIGDRSRFDFLLTETDGGKLTYVEVKSVTLSLSEGIAHFPDAKTERGQKHLRLLMDTVEQGHRAVMLYICMRGDCRQFSLAADIDKRYAELLGEAAGKGVQIIAYGVKVNKRGFYLFDRMDIVQ
ncbi:MAG: DNA/RNA nuclease SfsA [Fibrobacteria bacterium]|nr:DNA/RNA nuclease SfsA [Fibrobacteria bacterium]